MKILKLKFRNSILGCLSAVICLSIFLTSCEKTEDVIRMQMEDDNINITKNNNKNSIDENTETLEPVLHMSISDDLTEEEANAQWEAKVNEYISQQKLEEPGLSERRVRTKMYFRITTKTGTRAGDDTDALVYGRIHLYLNGKFEKSDWYKLDHKGADRSRGYTDNYLLPFYWSSGIRSAKLSSAEVSLKGTDGWLMTHLNCSINGSDQSSQTTGKSYNNSKTDYWLANNSSSAWNYFRSWYGNSKGTIYF